MGFGRRWIAWIKWCITTASFSIIINSSPTSYLRSSRGGFYKVSPVPLLVCPRHGSALPFNRQVNLWRFLTMLFSRRKKRRGCSLERKIHLIDWKNVSKSKEKGGLGIRNLHVLNRALLRKWAWRFATNERAT